MSLQTIIIDCVWHNTCIESQYNKVTACIYQANRCLHFQINFDVGRTCFNKNSIVCYFFLNCDKIEQCPSFQINVEKIQERWWDALFVDEAKISVRKIDPSRPMTDLDDEAQAKLEEMMWNERQKALGLPQSGQQVTAIMADDNHYNNITSQSSVLPKASKHSGCATL